MARDDAARALAAWPEFAALAARLLAAWPPPTRGFHRLDFPDLAASADIAHLEAAEALRAWSGRADAWFLDGFSPARNPAMWRPEVLRLLADRSAPGARAASFTAAGQVRRDLAAAGFAVERRPGFAGKRHALAARWPGEPTPEAATPRVAIVGGGIAGAALSRAFRALGAAPRVFASGAPAASAAPAALVSPRLDAGLAAPAALFAQAHARALRLYEAGQDAIIARGALQIGAGERDRRRFETIAAADLFAPGSVLVAIDDPPSVWLADARVVEPARLLSSWLGEVEPASVARIERDDGAWRLLDQGGATRAEAEIVCVAAAMASAGLADLPLVAVRGQASFAEGVSWTSARLFPGGYAIPTRAGVLFGATHDRGDEDPAPRAADHVRNLAIARNSPDLAAAFAGRALVAHAGVRATTRDYLPLAGATPDGLFVLTGLGSRGFTLAPLLAEHVAALALDAPSPLPADLARTRGARPLRRARRASARIPAFVHRLGGVTSAFARPNRTGSENWGGARMAADATLTDQAGRALPAPGAVVFRHAFLVRLTHWINAAAIVILIGSGLNIFNAHPQLYWGLKGSEFDTPFLSIGAAPVGGVMHGFLKVAGVSFDTTGVLGWSNSIGRMARAFPSWITIPGVVDLADARHWHFFFAWILVANGLLYLVWSLASRHLTRDLWPTPDDLRAIPRSVIDHLRLRHPTGEAARRYNVLQRLAYLGLILAVVGMVLTGLSMSPGVDAAWPWLLDLFGGRQSARTLHFVFASLIVLFIVVHLVEVVLAGPINEVGSMITGRYRLPRDHGA